MPAKEKQGQLKPYLYLMKSTRKRNTIRRKEKTNVMKYGHSSLKNGSKTLHGSQQQETALFVSSLITRFACFLVDNTSPCIQLQTDTILHLRLLSKHMITDIHNMASRLIVKAIIEYEFGGNIICTGLGIETRLVEQYLAVLPHKSNRVLPR